VSASAHHRVEPRSDHARAVLFVCDLLTAQGATVIAANTDEAGEPQIFAQSDAGELAFYLVRAGLAEPSGAALERFRALASRHKVAAYFAPVALMPELHCPGFRAL
jgi:hypothetical protein